MPEQGAPPHLTNAERDRMDKKMTELARIYKSLGEQDPMRNEQMHMRSKKNGQMHMRSKKTV